MHEFSNTLDKFLKRDKVEEFFYPTHYFLFNIKIFSKWQNLIRHSFSIFFNISRICLSLKNYNIQ